MKNSELLDECEEVFELARALKYDAKVGFHGGARIAIRAMRTKLDAIYAELTERMRTERERGEG